MYILGCSVVVCDYKYDIQVLPQGSTTVRHVTALVVVIVVVVVVLRFLFKLVDVLDLFHKVIDRSIVTAM